MSEYKGYPEPGSTYWDGRLRRSLNGWVRSDDGDFGPMIAFLDAARELAVTMQEGYDEHAPEWLAADDDAPLPEALDALMRSELVELHHMLHRAERSMPGLPAWVLYDGYQRRDYVQEPKPWSGEFVKAKAEERAEAYREVLNRSRDWQVRKGHVALHSIWHPDCDEHVAGSRLERTRRTHTR